MKERIIAFLEAENITSSQFAEFIGVQASSISHIVSGRNNPSLDFILKMLSSYPEIDPEWLLFGKGTMYRLNDISGSIKGENSLEMPLNDEQPLLFDSKSDDTSVHKDDNSNEKDRLSLEKPGNGVRARRIIVLYADNTYQEFDT